MNQDKALGQSNKIKNGFIQTALIFASTLPLLLTLLLFNHLYGTDGAEARLGNTGNSIPSEQFN